MLNKSILKGRAFPAVIFILLIVLLVGCTKTRTITQSEAIPFKRTTIKDSTLYKGMKKFEKKGIAGLRQVIYKEKYSGDEFISRKKISEKVVAKPVNEIVKVGTIETVRFIAISGSESFELILKSYSRETTMTKGKKPIAGDFLRIDGSLKNNGDKTAKIGAFLDIAAIHPSIKTGLSFLKISAPQQLEAGQSVAVNWEGPINPGKKGQNTAITDLSQIQLLPRLFIGPKNKQLAPTKTLQGLPGG